MSILTDFALKHILPILERIAPHWIGKVKVNFAVAAEKDKRPHPFSLWTGMATGRPTEGETAATAIPLPAHAPAAGDVVAAIARPAFAPSGYVSWPGLADRRYTGRHLPPAEVSGAPLPDIEEVVRTLYLRAGQLHAVRADLHIILLFRAMVHRQLLAHRSDRPQA